MPTHASGDFKIVAPFVCMPPFRAITFVCATTLISHVRCTPLIKFTEPQVLLRRRSRLYIKLILKWIKLGTLAAVCLSRVGIKIMRPLSTVENIRSFGTRNLELIPLSRTRVAFVVPEHIQMKANICGFHSLRLHRCEEGSWFVYIKSANNLSGCIYVTHITQNGPNRVILYFSVSASNYIAHRLRRRLVFGT